MEVFVGPTSHDLIKSKLPMVTLLTSASLLTYLIVGIVILIVHKIVSGILRHRQLTALYGKEAPGPRPWPVIGSLHLMDGYKIPYAAFTALRDHYGDVFSITLGTSKCLVVNDLKSVREVLSEKDSDFDSRPDFKRFDEALFGGDKQNSLAFCDNTSVHSKRRQILKPHTFPHAQSFNWTRLGDICQDEMKVMLSAIQSQLKNGTGLVDVKTLVAKASGNIFNKYFCSTPTKAYDDPAFCNYINSFDKIFYEVNNGRAMDFLPWLKPFMSRELKGLAKNAAAVRHFVEEEIIKPKREEFVTRRRSSADFLDGLMDYIDQNESGNNDGDVKLNKEHAMYALEDILGGHSGVESIIMRNLIDLAVNKSNNSEHDIQTKIRQQICDVIGDAEINLNNKKDMHLINAAMNETIRLTCSPIVPHQATRDSTVGGHRVTKGTVVFINNHFLNTTEDLWTHPDQYDPFRFLSTDGIFKKPDHFQPFSVGRRSCMGYKIVQIVSYFVVANLLSHYRIEMPAESELQSNGLRPNPELQYGMLALPPAEYTLKLTSHCVNGA